MKLKITVLGCGNSTGVPAIGDHWGSCDPNEPKNVRTRCSLAVQSEQTTIIIDTGPDFSGQMTREKIPTLDAVLYTHAHGDHINGIDELRIITLRNKKLTPVYGNAWTMKDLQDRYDYMFKGNNHELYPPLLVANTIDNFGQEITVGDISFVPFNQDHGTCETVGYRFGDFGYSTDMLRLDDTAIKTLKGVKIWIVDGCAYKQTNNPVHANLEALYEFNEQIGAEQVYLTSLSLAMDYQALLKELPKGFAPAYDGLVLHTG
jgi:phosphoribosyl 1,2-cyclic phosphate phosphodiesterase